MTCCNLLSGVDEVKICSGRSDSRKKPQYMCVRSVRSHNSARSNGEEESSNSMCKVIRHFSVAFVFLVRTVVRLGKAYCNSQA